MIWLQIIVGLLLGFALPFGITYLIWVYPYTKLNLNPLFISTGCGVFIGLVTLFTILFMVSEALKH